MFKSHFLRHSQGRKIGSPIMWVISIRIFSSWQSKFTYRQVDRILPRINPHLIFFNELPRSRQQ